MEYDVTSQAQKSAHPDPSCSVCVAVHIRPLIATEIAEGCQLCLQGTTQPPQVFAGSNSFTYDHVFGGGAASEQALYNNCVFPLVEGLFNGYNATVFAYGQTGSGKTHTMGSAFGEPGAAQGVIPNAMHTIFSRIKTAAHVDFTIRVGFVEILTDDIRDLLLHDQPGDHLVQIREMPGGGICLAGALEKEVTTKEEMAEILRMGSLQRATAATSMNRHSSRSHAIFTITVEQRRRPQEQEDPNAGHLVGDGNMDDDLDEYLCAKLHLVDLAGSERAKRTKAEGQRLREGININKGLLALGNVISALSDGKSHVPYRDSKLTRMLQDSLGGNSRTVMIACVSPADVNLEESTNTLRYANRARNIKNKPVVNRDANAAQLAHLRQQLAAAKAEILSLRQRDQSAQQVEPVFPTDASSTAMSAQIADELQMRVSQLDVEVARLNLELAQAKQDCVKAAERELAASAERDAALLALEEQQGHLQAAGSQPLNGRLPLMKTHLSRIAGLESEVKRLKKIQRASGAYILSAQKMRPVDSMEVGIAHTPGIMPVSPSSRNDADSPSNDSASLEEDAEYLAEANAHRLEQESAASNLEQLQKTLEAKQQQMAKIMSGDSQMAVLKSQYDRVLKDLQAERDELQRERLQLLEDMQRMASSKDESRTAMETKYKQRLKQMDDKIKDVAARERKYAKVERLQAQSQEACQRLEREMLAIKQQKVQLARQMERSAKDFQDWKRKREQEVMTLKKEGRKAAAHVHKLKLLQAKQQAVLRRKTEEAEAARKRLKEMMDVHQRASETRAQRPVPQAQRANSVEAQPNSNAPLLRDDKARKEWIEHELDMCCQSFEVQRILEGEKAVRAETARQHKEVSTRIEHTQNQSEREALSTHLVALNEQLDQQSKQIVSTQQQLMRAKSEEEQRGQAAADARRWTGLKQIVEARSLLKSLFRHAVQQKAQLYESHAELAEAREETDDLRMKLQAAMAEAAEAQARASHAQTALAEALAPPSPATSDALSPVPVLSPDKVNGSPHLEGLLVDIDAARQGGLGEQILTRSPLSEFDIISVSESEDSSSQEDEEDAWDPSHATPAVGRLARRQRSLNGQTASLSIVEDEDSSDEPKQKATRDSLEHPVLMNINRERSRDGLSPIVKLTVPVLKQHLKGKIVNGDVWKAGNKKREHLLEDYRDYLQEREQWSSPRMPGQIVGARGQLDFDSRLAEIDLSETSGAAEEARAGGDRLDTAVSLSHWPPDQQSPLRASFARLKSKPLPAQSGHPLRNPVTTIPPPSDVPPAIFYDSVRQQCEAAMKRAQALRERMDLHGAATRQPQTNGKAHSHILGPTVVVSPDLRDSSEVASKRSGQIDFSEEASMDDAENVSPNSNRTSSRELQMAELQSKKEFPLLPLRQRDGQSSDSLRGSTKRRTHGQADSKDAYSPEGVQQTFQPQVVLSSPKTKPRIPEAKRSASPRPKAAWL